MIRNAIEGFNQQLADKKAEIAGEIFGLSSEGKLDEAIEAIEKLRAIKDVAPGIIGKIKLALEELEQLGLTDPNPNEIFPDLASKLRQAESPNGPKNSDPDKFVPTDKIDTTPVKLQDFLDEIGIAEYTLRRTLTPALVDAGVWEKGVHLVEKAPHKGKGGKEVVEIVYTQAALNVYQQKVKKHLLIDPNDPSKGFIKRINTNRLKDLLK
jgi:hypothetical protein